MGATRSCPAIAIVGAGAAGTLTAAHLAASATGDLDLLLVDPRPSTGRGVAYGTTDGRHRLNVPAAKMSAWPDDPDHFLRWLRTVGGLAADPGHFAGRHDYGSYLADTLAETVDARHGLVRLDRRYERVTGLAPCGPRVRLRLGPTGTRTADAVVLATGTPPPTARWAPAELVRSPRFVADPWAPGALARLGGDGPVLLVGTGLTMVDVALTLDRPGRVLHAVSRHGLLPAVHAGSALPPYPPPVLPAGPLKLSDLRAAVHRHAAAAETLLGDWRPAIDSLRPITAEVWGRLSSADRAEFLRSDAREWEVHRHRMPPDVGARIGRCRDDGRLQVRAAEVAGVREVGDALDVTLSEGTTLRVAAVVNCTGPDLDLCRGEDPLALELLTSGCARPGPLDLGLDTDEAGRVRDSAGAASPVLWTLGSLRRGQLWETTAVPEIRAQAAALAVDILAALPARRGRVRPRDLYGLPLTTSAVAAERYADGLARILRLQTGAEAPLHEAVECDPGFALGHAALALLGHEWGVPVAVEGALEAARAAVTRRADERERSFVHAVTEHIRRPGPDAAAALLRHVDAYPEDALAVSIAVPTIAFTGATEVPAEAAAVVEGLAPTYGDDWWYSGLLAFIRQEQERWDEALALSEQALAVEPRSGHAVHARAHVYYETAAHEQGLAFLDPWISSCGRGASHRAHFSWHAALHELALGEAEAVRRRYARELAPPHVHGVRALVDSASLLWRCALAGAWPGRVPIQCVLDTVDAELLQRPATPFTALHAAVALTAAADATGLRRLQTHAASQADPVFREVVVPLAQALVDLTEGRCAAAAGRLWGLQDRVHRLRGSAAQREIVEDTLLFALVQADWREQARAVLERRLDRRPSRRDAAQLRRLDPPPSHRAARRR